MMLARGGETRALDEDSRDQLGGVIYWLFSQLRVLHIDDTAMKTSL